MLWRWGVLAALSHWSDKSQNLAPWNLQQNTWTKSLVDLVNSKGGPYRCAIHRSIHQWFTLIYRQRIAVPHSTSLYFWSFQVNFSNVFFPSFLVCLLDEVASHNEVWPSIASNVWSFMRRNCHRSVQRATARDEESPRCMKNDQNRNQWLRLNMIFESVREPFWWGCFNSLTWWCHCRVSTGSSSNWWNSTSTGLAKSRYLRGWKFLVDGYPIPISTCDTCGNSNFNSRWPCCLKVEGK